MVFRPVASLPVTSCVTFWGHIQSYAETVIKSKWYLYALVNWRCCWLYSTAHSDPLLRPCQRLIFPACQGKSYTHTLLTSKAQEKLYRLFYGNYTKGNMSKEFPPYLEELFSKYPKCRLNMEKHFCSSLFPPCFPPELAAWYTLCKANCHEILVDCPELERDRRSVFWLCNSLPEGTTSHGYCKHKDWPSPDDWIGHFMGESGCSQFYLEFSVAVHVLPFSSTPISFYSDQNVKSKNNYPHLLASFRGNRGNLDSSFNPGKVQDMNLSPGPFCRGSWNEIASTAPTLNIISRYPHRPKPLAFSNSHGPAKRSQPRCHRSSSSGALAADWKYSRCNGLLEKTTPVADWIQIWKAAGWYGSAGYLSSLSSKRTRKVGTQSCNTELLYLFHSQARPHFVVFVCSVLFTTPYAVAGRISETNETNNA